MSQANSLSPRFANPPIAELALSVQLAEPSPLRTLHLGLLSESFKGEFPETQEQPPLPSIARLLGRARIPRIDVEVITEQPSPRFWLLDRTNTRLIQLQRDRIGFNWRRIPNDASYPSFEKVLEGFKRVVTVARGFATERLSTDLTPTHAELTYVDHIGVGDSGGPQSTGDLGRVLKFWDSAGLPRGGAAPEEAGCYVRYRVGVGARSSGQLTLEVLPGTRTADDAAVLVMQTVVRLALGTRDWECVWEALSYGQSEANRVFVEVTEDGLQQTWGRL